MKKIISIILSLAALLISPACENKINTWGDGDPALEHVYYVGFYKTGTFSDYLTCEIDADGSTRYRYGSSATNGTWINTSEPNTASIPVQFHSERVRNYDVVTFFWITSELQYGVDYTVTAENGDAINPISTGLFSLTWKQAVKGIQYVKIQRISDATGTIKVNTLDPDRGTPQSTDISTTVNNTTADYEVRGLTHDWEKVSVVFN